MQYDPRLRSGIASTASALGVSPVDLATAISYETAGTFDPTKRGPTTQWGQHRGLIQFGEPQAQRYGVDWSDPIGSQLGPNGAVANYLRDTGVKPGMGLLDIYSAINAGGVGRYGRSDANNGGAPGTVADKVNNQMSGHRRNAMAMLGGAGDDTLMGGQGADTMSNINFASTSTGPVNAVSLEELEQKEALAKALQSRSSGIKDIRHPTQGLAQMSDALFGALISKKNSEDRKDHNTALAQVLMGNGGGGPISDEKLATVMALNPKLGQQLYTQQREAEQAQQLQAQRMAADHARRMDDRAYAAAQTADQRAYEAAQWEQRNQSQNDEWTRRQEYARENAPRPEAGFIVSGEQAAEYGLDPTGSYNITAGPNGVSASRIGGGGTNVTVDMGGEPGRYLYAEDAGLPKGWRFDTQSQQAEMIPGGPAAVEAAQIEEKAAAAQGQTRHKLGTTLSSLALNINEIEDGGLPVTGAGGDLRRTWAGRLLTGSDAVDFGNRTNQVTDAAALDEISRMRQNSPTGGAVGALTDGERVAIGNAVTALNNSTSAEEYTRAAKEFRTLVLDLSYGSGRWFLGDDGVSVGFAGGESSFPDPASMSGTEIEAYIAVNPVDSWPPEQRSAFAGRLRELKGGN